VGVRKRRLATNSEIETRMPIQPLNVSSGNYNQIPDAEDVTPIDNSIAKKVQRSFKVLVVVIGFCVVIASILTFAMRFTASVLKEPVRIYQTSMENGDRLKLLSANDLASRGFTVESIAFGNVKCSKDSASASDEVCTSTTPNPAVVNVKSEQKFQKIVGFGGAFTEAAAYNFYKLPSTVQKKVRVVRCKLQHQRFVSETEVIQYGRQFSLCY
jgi:hypothetical protein